MKTPYALVLFCCLQTLGAAQQTRTYVAHATYPASGAQAYKDPKSGTLIYVESDGRHVAAISPEGKLLWCKNPFLDAHLEEYREKYPRVARIGPVPDGVGPYEKAPDNFVFISLTNSQFGWIRISDGGFQFRGQD